MLMVAFIPAGGLLLAWIVALWSQRGALLILALSSWATGISLAIVAWMTLLSDWFWPFRLLACCLIAILFGHRANRAVEDVVPLLPRSRRARGRKRAEG